MYYTDSERLEKMLEYIRTNSRVTKTDVIKYMKKMKMSSLVTTHNLIKDLKKRRMVKVEMDKPRKQSSRRGRNHYLVINDENVFNAITKDLSDIENNIDLWDKFESDRDYRKENQKSYIKFYNQFFLDYHYNYNLMQLHSYLETSNNRKVIQPEDYSKLLNKRINELIIRLNRQLGKEGVYYNLQHALIYLEDFFGNYDVKRDSVNSKLVDNLKTRIQNILKFLSEYNLNE